MSTATKQRRDVAEDVTDRILAALESGTVPWARPWSAAGIAPTSAATGRPYRGINTWLLAVESLEHGYGSPLWLTFKQARALGGSVRKGEHGTLVVFWKLLDVTRENATTGEPEPRKVPMMRGYYVFNLDQCDGVKLSPKLARLVATDREPVVVDDAVSDVLAGYRNGPELEHRAQDRAFYVPSTDRITLPVLESFQDSAGYAGTLFHELVHSTGHESRLARFERTGEPQHFGSERYAREELVAEMGAAILAATVGVDVPTDNTAAYVASWLRALRDDRSLVISAAQYAQKAVDRILGTTFDKEETDAV